MSGDALVAALRFSGGWPPHSGTPDHLRRLLRDEFSDDQRRKFLSFVTACTVLPTAAVASSASSSSSSSSSTSGGKVTVAFVPWGSERLPLAHTCFDRLDLPDYDDHGLLRTKLTWCLDNLEMAGFGEA